MTLSDTQIGLIIAGIFLITIAIAIIVYYFFFMEEEPIISTCSLTNQEPCTEEELIDMLMNECSNPSKNIRSKTPKNTSEESKIIIDEACDNLFSLNNEAVCESLCCVMGKYGDYCLEI